MKTHLKIAIAFGFLTFSCQSKDEPWDATGAFEAEETLISAETQGALKIFLVEEGQTLTAGQKVGYIDSVQPYLKKKQLVAQISAILRKKPDIPVQLAVLEEQLRTARHEKNRLTHLVEGDAATPKQVDDITAQIELITRQINAQKSTLDISASGINLDVVPLQVQVEQLDDLLSKCRLVNPLNGTVLTKYAEANEIVTPGKPLYKIADLSTLILRVYVTGNQLARVKLNQKVQVLTDDGTGGYDRATGTITWISDKAEFTPKSIQTKDERANRVYALKIRVPNGGRYKIGMYGEIKF